MANTLAKIIKRANKVCHEVFRSKSLSSRPKILFGVFFIKVKKERYFFGINDKKSHFVHSFFFRTLVIHPVTTEIIESFCHRFAGQASKCG